MRSPLAVLALWLLACVPPPLALKASLKTSTIDPRDRAGLDKVLSAARIPPDEVEVRRSTAPHPLTSVESIEAPMAIWIVNGRVVGLYLINTDPADRCVIETFCRITGWFRGRSAPRFPGFATLGELPELRTLHLHNFEMPSLEGIGRLERLRQLLVQGCKLTSLAGVQQLHGLRVLDVTWNQLVTADEVSSLSQLGILRLPSNRLSRLPDLGRLARLHTIAIDDNPLRRIDFRALSLVGSLGRMRELDLSGLALQGLHGISWFSELRFLRLAKNGLQRLDGLEGLRFLERLYVDLNQLKSLELRDLPRLKLLEAAWNAIERVNVAGLPALERLVLHTNRIARFGDLVLPPLIQNLNISENPLSSTDGLEALFLPLRKLEWIDLYGTPMVKADATRLQALQAKHKTRIFLHSN
jgi:Leucine-rich repeat (LRR) protein